MDYTFEITDKIGKRTHLTKERWGEHIKLEHPDVGQKSNLALHRQG